MYERAREIFVTHGGSAFHMGRDLVLDEYKSYNVPKEIERKWAEEEIKEKLIKVCCDFDSGTRIVILSHTINYINDFDLYEYISPIIEVCPKIEPEMDSFDRMYLCEVLANRIPKEFLKKDEIKSYILSICKKVKEHPELPKDFECSDDFADVFSTESILRRINEVIIKIKTGDGILR